MVLSQPLDHRYQMRLDGRACGAGALVEVCGDDSVGAWLPGEEVVARCVSASLARRAHRPASLCTFCHMLDPSQIDRREHSLQDTPAPWQRKKKGRPEAPRQTYPAWLDVGKQVERAHLADFCATLEVLVTCVARSAMGLKVMPS